jgi:hypothetical protein
VAVTATFRLLYVFVVIEHGSRRLVRVAVTAQPIEDKKEMVGRIYLYNQVKDY